MATLRRTGTTTFGNNLSKDSNNENLMQPRRKAFNGKSISNVPTRRTALANIANQTVDTRREGKGKANGVLRPSSKAANLQSKAQVKVKEESVVPPLVKQENVEKDAIESFSCLQLGIVDIDADDMDESAQLCPEYAKDIYKYLHVVEKRLLPTDYMQNQTEVNEKMRSILVDWLNQVHARFNLLQETLYMTIYLVDRYLAVKDIPRGNLQLVGVSAMLLASKYEEMYAPEVADFVYITDNAYSAAQVREMEKDIGSELDWDLSGPICLHFLRRFSKAGGVDATKHTLAKYLMELVLVDYKSSLMLPSMVAASALCISLYVIDESTWTPTLEHYTTYTQKDLRPCIKRMTELLSKVEVSKQKAVYSKYSSSKFMRISRMTQLQSSCLQDLEILL